MGGDAYHIPGTPEPRLWHDAQPPPAPVPPPPFWRRLLGERWGLPEALLPRVIVSRNGDRCFELSPGTLPAQLLPDLRNWVSSRIPTPSQASTAVLGYMRDTEPRLFVRGLQRAAQDVPEFWIQIGFSGCAGEAETSARVATHWTALWHGAEHERIAGEYLRPFGFAPHPYHARLGEPRYFLAAGDLGYLEFTPAHQRSARQPAFELDHSTEEAHSGDPLLERLHEAFGQYMAEGRCRCQICEPAFVGAEMP